MTTVSIIIPVYNELDTLPALLEQVLETTFDGPEKELLKKELIVVEDGSQDGTREYLLRLSQQPDCPYRLLLHEHNQGKGAAIRTGLAHARGQFIVIQDGDLEYHPNDYKALLRYLQEHPEQHVVYGSRFLRAENRAQFSPLFYWGNRLLTEATNLLYGARLTDMETCYKAFRAPAIRALSLQANRFDIEPEITAKVLRSGLRIIELPIGYHARTAQKGKKITWRDGFSALWTLIRCKI